MSHTDKTGLGADPTRVDTDWIPRNPASYRITDHYRDRRSDEDRIVDDALAEDCIASGELHRESAGKWSFRKEIDGCEIHIYASLDDYLQPAVITGYGNVLDVGEAHKSDRFGSRAVSCERFRNLINEESPWSDDFRWLRLSPPTSVEGHHIATDRGRRFVKCDTCGRQFTSWDDLSDSRCN